MILPSLSDYLGFIENYIKNYGIILIPVGAFLENSVILGFLFPGVTVIFLSGFIARTSGESLILIIALATFGSFLGDNLDYFIGRHAGKILEEKPLFAKPISLVEPLLKKHGIWAVFFGRFSNWSRAWIALACGITRYKYWKFAPVSLLSAISWTSVWIAGGYLLGGERQLLETWFNRAADLALLTFLGFLIYYFRTRLKLVLELVIFFSHKMGKRAIHRIRGTVKSEPEVQS